eukprot:2096894-Rhodomonas_salina.1
MTSSTRSAGTPLVYRAMYSNACPPSTTPQRGVERSEGGWRCVCERERGGGSLTQRASFDPKA